MFFDTIFLIISGGVFGCLVWLFCFVGCFVLFGCLVWFGFVV